MPTTVLNGLYYITSQYTEAVITLADGAQRTNLTTWQRYDGLEQQWNVSMVNEQYTFRNVLYGYYISFKDRSVTDDPYTSLYACATPYPFIVEEYKGGFLITAPDFRGEAFNVAGPSSANNTPVIFWPFKIRGGPDNFVWFFNSTTNSPSPKNPSSTSRVRPIVSGIIGGFVALICLLALALYLGRRKRSSIRPSGVGRSNNRDLSFQPSPFIPQQGILPMPASLTIDTGNPFTRIRRPGHGSIRKPLLVNSASSPSDQNNISRMEDGDTIMRAAPNVGNRHTIAVTSFGPSPFTSTSERGPPPEYE